MQILMIVAAMLLTAVMIPFVGHGASRTRERADAVAETATGQFEAFARAAWFAARRGQSGWIDRNALALPQGFSDDPAYPLQARTEGSYLYVWGERPGYVRQDLVFPDGDQTVDIGFSTDRGLILRGGATAQRPSWLPANSTIARLRI